MTGDTVSFNCSIRNYWDEGRPSFRFTLPNRTQVISTNTDGIYGIDTDFSQDNAKIYTINSVKPSKAGVYSCEVGGNTITTELYVECKLLYVVSQLHVIIYIILQYLIPFKSLGD